MPTYHITVPHENNKKACDLVVSTFKSTGSHFLTQAEFGCNDGVHKAWIHVEANDKNDAKRTVPPPFRDDAIVVEVEKLALDDIDKHKEQHD